MVALREKRWASPKEIYEARKWMEERESCGCVTKSGGPYRGDVGLSDRLDDLESRLDAFERDGRDEMKKLQGTVSALRFALLALALAFAVAVIGAIATLDSVHTETIMMYHDHEALHLIPCNVSVR